jgi:hypothetical protein
VPAPPKVPAKRKVPLASEGVGEVTRYFIAQAGMNSRNPPWKIALAVALAIALPVGVLYMLSELKVVQLQVTRVDDSGREVKESVFSIEGVSGLRDKLLGKRPPARAVAKGAEKPRPHRPEPKPVPSAAVAPPQNDELAAFYGEEDRVDVGPQARQPVASVKGNEEGGPPPAEVAKVVASVQPAFQFCIEQELRKNPKFRGGRINLVATVGGSGSVKQANIDRRDVNGSKLGDCLKSKARRMVFNSFPGDDVDVEIPLILGVN